MFGGLAWSCDFCGKSGLQFSGAGILYCSLCKQSYGEIPEENEKWKKAMEELVKITLGDYKECSENQTHPTR